MHLMTRDYYCLKYIIHSQQMGLLFINSMVWVHYCLKSIIHSPQMGLLFINSMVWVHYCLKSIIHPPHIIIQGAVSIRKTVLPGMAIPMLKIRRPNGRLIFNMEIAIRR